MEINDFDISIIGGSFAGMSSALALSSLGLTIAIIEKDDIINNDRKRDGKGYAISNRSLTFFEEIGIKDEVLKEAGRIEDIKITDYESCVFVDFLSKDVSSQDFGALIESYVVHNALRNKVLKDKNIKVICPHSYKDIEFKDDGVEILLEDESRINSKIVLACDGRLSNLRQRFDSRAVEKWYGQRAIVFNIKHELPHNNVAWEKFLPGGPLAILPLKDRNRSSIVWILKDELAQVVLELDGENFKHQLLKKMENVLGDIEVVGEKFSYPLLLVEASKFYYEKLLFVGDAACGVHPIAGQGLNLGFESIVILRDLIKNALDRGEDFASMDLIDEYSKQASKGARKMVIATDILNSLFESKSLSVKIARDFGLSVVQKVPFLKKFFIKNAGGF